MHIATKVHTLIYGINRRNYTLYVITDGICRCLILYGKPANIYNKYKEYRQSPDLIDFQNLVVPPWEITLNQPMDLQIIKQCIIMTSYSVSPP